MFAYDVALLSTIHAGAHSEHFQDKVPAGGIWSEGGIEDANEC